MQILSLTKEHLNEFINLYIEFFKELRGKQGWNPHDEVEYQAEALHYFKRGDIILLAFEGDRAAGFIRVSSREDSFWIEELYVRPEFRGKGIGKALVKRAEEEVLKWDIALYLFVLPQDKDAITFWKKLGYDMINTIELVKDLEPTARSEILILLSS
ncbi:GNAT family N-acetyltransferase [Thermococcus sp.]|uniref:GNAT family N-acetyltransferase n=1 Tax=Thermococcus sp. TaxID=35749 RepID=UPI00263418D6|nr:GNAT family N-acetyltransferase [Thermococcus sp.]